MTHILANFGAMETGATQLRSGAAELQATEQTQMSQLMGSVDYWSDIAGGNGELGATGQMWRARSDASHTEATQRSSAIDTSNADYQSGLQQAVSIISQFG
jgi:hypothetical protein